METTGFRLGGLEIKNLRAYPKAWGSILGRGLPLQRSPILGRRGFLLFPGLKTR